MVKIFGFQYVNTEKWAKIIWKRVCTNDTVIFRAFEAISLVFLRLPNMYKSEAPWINPTPRESTYQMANLSGPRIKD